MNKLLQQKPELTRDDIEVADQAERKKKLVQDT